MKKKLLVLICFIFILLGSSINVYAGDKDRAVSFMKKNFSQLRSYSSSHLMNTYTLTYIDVDRDKKKELIMLSGAMGYPLAVLKPSGTSFRILYRRINSSYERAYKVVTDPYNDIWIYYGRHSTGYLNEQLLILRWNGKQVLPIWSGTAVYNNDSNTEMGSWNDINGRVRITGSTPQNLVYTVEQELGIFNYDLDKKLTRKLVITAEYKFDSRAYRFVKIKSNTVNINVPKLLYNDNLQEVSITGIDMYDSEAAIVSILGEPSRTEEQTYEGVLFKRLYYDGLVCYLMEDRVVYFELTSTSYSTYRGLWLGDSYKRIKQLYGAPDTADYDDSVGKYYYYYSSLGDNYDDGFEFIFYFDGDYVSSVDFGWKGDM